MCTVAIVNRHPFLRHAISSVCLDTGLTVFQLARDGMELLEYLNNASPLPDIIFIDIDLPGKGGIEVARTISLTWPAIKIICFATVCHEKHITDMLRNGAAAYLTNDSEPQEIVRAIQAVREGRIYIPVEIIEEWKIPASYLYPRPKEKFRNRLLSDREYEFLEFCASDLSYKEIAHLMSVEYKTIDNYRAAVSSKLNIHTRAGLAVYAGKYGLRKVGNF